MTNNDVIEKIHDVIVTRNRYHEYAIRAIRDATEEELQSSNEYVKSISKETGVDFFTEVSEMDEKKNGGLNMESKEDVFNALLESWEGYFAEYIAEHGDPNKTDEIIDPQKDEFIRRWKNAI